MASCVADDVADDVARADMDQANMAFVDVNK